MTPSEAPKGELVLYQTDDGRTRIECRFEGDTIWLTQAQMATLFETTPQNITIHLRDLYATQELDAAATCKSYLQVRNEGARRVQRSTLHYSLPAVLAVGFRVRSHRGTQFRKWAIKLIEEFVEKGFVMDDERLKNPPGPGQTDYFDDLLERIRDIRSSERRFYQKVLDIYALSADYDPRVEASRMFFKTVQNKLHWAAHGQTAAEVIAARADASKPNMGLSSWTGSTPRKGDVEIAKNYLSFEELEALNGVVTAYLEFAELQAKNRRVMYMRRDALARLNPTVSREGLDEAFRAGALLRGAPDTSVRRYQNRAIEAAQVIEELIELAKEMRAAQKRGEELGLSSDELAFYDALEVSDTAVKVLGDETLRTIARELVDTVKRNVTIDWTVKESVRAKLRVIVKRILRKYGYPPDKQEAATNTVLQQAELLSDFWTKASAT